MLLNFRTNGQFSEQPVAFITFQESL